MQIGVTLTSLMSYSDYCRQRRGRSLRHRRQFWIAPPNSVFRKRFV